LGGWFVVWVLCCLWFWIGRLGECFVLISFVSLWWLGFLLVDVFMLFDCIYVFVWKGMFVCLIFVCLLMDRLCLVDCLIMC